MVGRQTPILALVVPLILVFIVDGRRGVRQTWIPALLAGFVFAVAQFVTSNYISVQLTDIVASLLAAGSLVLLVRVWQPAETLTAELADAASPRQHATLDRRDRSASCRPAAAPAIATAAATGGGVGPGRGRRPTTAAEVLRAYAPYLVIIIIFSITNIPAVVDFLAKEPWTYLFDWPGLDIVNAAGDPVVTQFKFNWLPAAGTLLILAGLISMVILKVSPGRAFKTYARDVRRAALRDHHRDGGAGAGLRDEPVRADRLAGRLAGRDGRGCSRSSRRSSAGSAWR